jgi:hypothetical protein
LLEYLCNESRIRRLPSAVSTAGRFKGPGNLAKQGQSPLASATNVAVDTSRGGSLVSFPCITTPRMTHRAVQRCNPLSNGHLFTKDQKSSRGGALLVFMGTVFGYIELRVTSSAFRARCAARREFQFWLGMFRVPTRQLTLPSLPATEWHDTPTSGLSST